MNDLQPFSFRKLSNYLLFFIFSLLYFIFYSSCGNRDDDKHNLTLNDSTPSDIRSINEKLNTDRNNPDLYFLRAKADFSHKNFQNAINDMNLALKINNKKPEYYIFLSDIYFAQNQISNMKYALSKAVAIDSAKSESLLRYSRLFYLLKQYDTATFYVNRCLHYDKTNAVAHFQKGMILKEWGDTAKAISSFQSAAEFNQQYYDAYMQLGILFSEKKNPLALGYFDNALGIDAKSIEAHYGKGMFLQKTGDYANALKEYKIIIGFAPENKDAAFNTGAIYYEQKKYDESLKIFETLIQSDENFYRAYYGRGRCYESLGQKQKAITDYKHCLVIKPDYDLAAIQLNAVQRK